MMLWAQSQCFIFKYYSYCEDWVHSLLPESGIYWGSGWEISVHQNLQVHAHSIHAFIFSHQNYCNSVFTCSVKPPWIKRSCKAPYQILEALSPHTCTSLTVLAPIIQNSFRLLEFTFKSLNGESHQQTFAPIYDSQAGPSSHLMWALYPPLNLD